jgi:hypothetical protein
MVGADPLPPSPSPSHEGDVGEFSEQIPLKDIGSWPALIFAFLVRSFPLPRLLLLGAIVTSGWIFVQDNGSGALSVGNWCALFWSIAKAMVMSAVFSAFAVCYALAEKGRFSPASVLGILLLIVALGFLGLLVQRYEFPVSAPSTPVVVPQISLPPPNPVPSAVGPASSRLGPLAPSSREDQTHESEVP